MWPRKIAHATLEKGPTVGSRCFVQGHRKVEEENTITGSYHMPMQKGGLQTRVENPDHQNHQRDAAHRETIVG